MPVLLLLIAGLVLVVAGRTGIGRGDLPGGHPPSPPSVPATVDRAALSPDATPWVLSRSELTRTSETLELAFADGRLWAAGPRMGLRGVDLRGRRFDLGADHEGPFAFVVIATGTDADTVWVGRSFFAQDDTAVTLRLERADTRAGRATTIPARMNLEGPVTAMAAGEEALWIACCGYDSEQSRILRLDPATLERRASIRMPRRVCEMRVGDGWLWAIDDRGIVARIDLQTNRVIATIETPVGSVPNGWLGPCNALAHAPGVIWAGGGSGTVARIDARTATLTWSSVLRINEQPVAVHRLAADADSLWMTSRGGELYRLTSGGHLTGAARINGARAVTIGGGAVWVGDDHGAVRRIDPAGVPSLPNG